MQCHDSGKASPVGRQLEDALDLGTLTGLSDAQLVGRFAAVRDATAESAFRELMNRHGPMVMGVCRQILRRPHDADDAFQATFLVLVRKAASIRVGESLAPWLYAVAYRNGPAGPCDVASRYRPVPLKFSRFRGKALRTTLAISISGRCFTKSSIDSPASTETRSCCATSRARRTKRPPGCSTGPSVRSVGGFTRS